MHDHSHEHDPETTSTHSFGNLNPGEEYLYHRQVMIHTATAIYTAGIPHGRVSPMAGEDPFFTPQEAFEKARELVRLVDDHVVANRIEPEAS